MFGKRFGRLLRGVSVEIESRVDRGTRGLYRAQHGGKRERTDENCRRYGQCESRAQSGEDADKKRLDMGITRFFPYAFLEVGWHIERLPRRSAANIVAERGLVFKSETTRSAKREMRVRASVLRRSEFAADVVGENVGR